MNFILVRYRVLLNLRACVVMRNSAGLAAYHQTLSASPAIANVFVSMSKILKLHSFIDLSV